MTQTRGSSVGASLASRCATRTQRSQTSGRRRAPRPPRLKEVWKGTDRLTWKLFPQPQAQTTQRTDNHGSLQRRVSEASRAIASCTQTTLYETPVELPRVGGACTPSWKVWREIMSGYQASESAESTRTEIAGWSSVLVGFFCASVAVLALGCTARGLCCLCLSVRCRTRRHGCGQRFFPPSDPSSIVGLSGYLSAVTTTAESNIILGPPCPRASQTSSR